jgi:hypothetical protein
VAQSMAQVPQVVNNIKALRALEAGSSSEPDAPHPAPEIPEPVTEAPNRALEDWRRRAGPVVHDDPLGGR